MIRFVLFLLLLIAATLVAALFRDQRGRRDTRVERLRFSFLHGTPLAGYSRTGALTEYSHPGGVRFRVPASWSVDLGGAPSSPVLGGRRLQVEVVDLERAAAAEADSLMTALKGLARDTEQTMELLPNGNVLMKTLEERTAGEPVVYSWRLGRATQSGARVAVFRLAVPIDTAADVIAQSDLAAVDREVRIAAFVEEAGTRPT
jgi:hypothetical protein